MNGDACTVGVNRTHKRLSFDLHMEPDEVISSTSHLNELLNLTRPIRLSLKSSWVRLSKLHNSREKRNPRFRKRSQVSVGVWCVHHWTSLIKLHPCRGGEMCTHTRRVTMGSMSRGSFRARVMRSAFRVRILWKRRRMKRAEVKFSNVGEGSSALGRPFISEVCIWNNTSSYSHTSLFHSENSLYTQPLTTDN